MKFQIKNRFTDEVIVEGEAETLKELIDIASKEKQEWIKNHQDVLQEHRYWFVQNCLGTLGVFTWEELHEIRKEKEE